MSEQDTKREEFLEDENHHDWPSEKLDSILSKLLTGDRPTGGAHDQGEYISIGGTQIDSEGYLDLHDLVYIPGEYFEKVSETQLQRHDILMVKDGANTGDVAIAWEDRPDIVTNEHILTLRVRNNVNSPYVFYYLLSHEGWKQLKGTITGSAQAGINKSFTSKVDINLPPLEEQRKIASVLYTVDGAIQMTDEITEQTHYIKKGVIQDVFHGKHKSHDQYISTPVGEIPSHWEVASIGQVVDTAQYGISESLSEDGQYPVFRMNNIRNGYMIEDPMKYINLEDDKFDKYKLEKRDILFNRTNSLELVGKTGIYELGGKHVFASYLIRLQTNEKVDPYYLNYYMNSTEAQNRMMAFATKGVSQANINATSIQQVKLPLPPLEEQKQIAKRIKTFDEQIKVSRKYKSQLKHLKRGLIQDLITGKVCTEGRDINVLSEVKIHE